MGPMRKRGRLLVTGEWCGLRQLREEQQRQKEDAKEKRRQDKEDREDKCRQE